MTTLDRAFWMAAAALAIGVYLAVYRPLGNTLDELDAERESLTLGIERDAQLARTTPALEKTLRETQGRIDALALGRDAPTLVATFVRNAATASVRDGVDIVAVDGHPPALAPSATDSHAGGDVFLATPIALTLRGSYSAIVAALRDLARTRVLTNVRLDSIERLHDVHGTRQPALVARLHIEILRRPEARPIRAATP